MSVSHRINGEISVIILMDFQSIWKTEAAERVGVVYVPHSAAALRNRAFNQSFVTLAQNTNCQEEASNWRNLIPP